MAISEETGALYFLQTDNTVHGILNGQTVLIDADTSGATFDGDGYLTGGVYTIELAAAGNNVYELRSDGSVWKYGGSATVWWLLDRNSDTVKIEATGGDLYQLHLVGGSVWRYTGPVNAPPPSIFFWTQIDNQPHTDDICAAGGRIYEMNGVSGAYTDDGSVRRYENYPHDWSSLLRGAPTQIAVAGGGYFLGAIPRTIYCVNAIYSGGLYAISDSGNSSLVQPGFLNPTIVASNFGFLYCIDQGGDVYRLVNNQWQPFAEHGLAGLEIAVSDYRLYLRTVDGSIWLYNSWAPSTYHLVYNSPTLGFPHARPAHIH